MECSYSSLLHVTRLTASDSKACKVKSGRLHPIKNTRFAVFQGSTSSIRLGMSTRVASRPVAESSSTDVELLERLEYEYGERYDSRTSGYRRTRGA